MIKATSKQHIILGITDLNMEKLKEGLPIKIDGKELGISKDIIILYGKNEFAIVNDLREKCDLRYAKIRTE